MHRMNPMQLHQVFCPLDLLEEAPCALVFAIDLQDRIHALRRIIDLSR